MTTPEKPITPAPSASDSATNPTSGVVSSGWLAGSSVFGGTADDHRIKRTFGATVASAVIHGGLLALVLFLLASKAAEMVNDPPPEIVHLIFTEAPGPGGGGGGSPEPAPPKPVEIPAAKPKEPVPIEVPPPPKEPPPPLPRLTAPVVTPNATLAQATGNSTVSLAAYGGEGRGRGLGSGSGDGVGPGEGGGFGGGVYGPGSGVTPPRQLKEVRPTYTSEAMRLKIQGSVELEIVILPNGTVGDVRITRSLDRSHGLDEEAIKAAKRWLFTPALDREGRPVAYRAPLILDFRLH